MRHILRSPSTVEKHPINYLNRNFLGHHGSVLLGLSTPLSVQNAPSPIREEGAWRGRCTSHPSIFSRNKQQRLDLGIGTTVSGFASNMPEGYRNVIKSFVGAAL